MDKRGDADLVQFKLRMREGLRAQIEQAAQASGESMNAEIVKRLEQSFQVGGLQGQGWLSVTLQAIGFAALRLEQITGKPYREHRPSTIALAQAAKENFLFGGAPRPHTEQLRKVHAEYKELEKSAEQKIAFLQELEVVQPANALAEFAPLSKVRHDLLPAANLLQRRHYFIKPDLRGPTKAWKITYRNEAISEQGLSQIEAALLDLVDIEGGMQALLDTFRELDKDEKAAEAEASRLNHILNNPDEQMPGEEPKEDISSVPAV